MNTSELVQRGGSHLIKALAEPGVVCADMVVRHPQTGKAIEALIVLRGEWTDIFMEQIATTRHLLNTGTASRFEEANLYVTVTHKGNT